MPGFLSEESFWEEEGGSALLQTNTHAFVSGAHHCKLQTLCPASASMPTLCTTGHATELVQRVQGWAALCGASDKDVPGNVLLQALVVTTSPFCSEFEVDVDAATHVFKVRVRILIPLFLISFSRQKDGRGQDVQVPSQEEEIHSCPPVGAEEVT